MKLLAIELLFHDLAIVRSCLAVFDQFQPVDLICWEELGLSMQPSDSPNDAAPPWLLQEVFPTLGPLILSIIDSCLTTSVLPKSSKVLLWNLFKNPGLDSYVVPNLPLHCLPWIKSYKRLFITSWCRSSMNIPFWKYSSPSLKLNTVLSLLC